MSDQSQALVDQLKRVATSSTNGHIAELIASAQEEALAEARCILRDIMLAAILKQALSEMQSAPTGSSDDVPDGAVVAVTEVTPGGPLADCRPAPTESHDAPDPDSRLPTPDSQLLHQEIEAIRNKIRENTELLAQLKTACPQPDGSMVQPDATACAADKVGETGCGCYVYGVLSNHDDPSGLTLPETGIDPAYAVYALAHRDVQALVSCVRLSEFGREALEVRLQDLEWLKGKVQAHQDIIQAMLAQRAIIPMRFCTIYQDEARVVHMLAEHYDRFVELLAWLRDKREWGVKLFCEREVLAARLADTSERVRELKAMMGQKAQGAAYFVKKQVDQAIAEESERISDEYAQRTHDVLSAHAEQSVVNPLQSKEITGRQEDMLLNGAYLVREGRLPAFRSALEGLAAEYREMGFACELTGPWPPYNFARIDDQEGAP